MLTSIYSCHTQQLPFSNLVLMEHQYVNIKTGKAFTGHVRSYYPNGKPKVKGVMHNGYQEGRWQFWHEEGQLRESTYFKAGERTGLLSSWAWCGNKLFEICYKKNLQHGPTIRYLNGLPITLENFSNGILQGKYLKWYENGQEATVGNYNAGKKCGTWYMFNKNGKLLHTEQF